MINRLIKIDTNGKNASKFTQNVELYDLIVPNILFLIDYDDEVFMSDQIDWERTRKGFQPGDNGHCIWMSKERGYVSAADFHTIGIRIMNNLRHVNGLSELCDELADIYEIKSWEKRHENNN